MIKKKSSVGRNFRLNKSPTFNAIHQLLFYVSAIYCDDGVYGVLQLISVKKRNRASLSDKRLYLYLSVNDSIKNTTLLCLILLLFWPFRNSSHLLFARRSHFEIAIASRKIFTHRKQRKIFSFSCRVLGLARDFSLIFRKWFLKRSKKKDVWRGKSFLRLNYLSIAWIDCYDWEMRLITTRLFVYRTLFFHNRVYVLSENVNKSDSRRIV